MLVVACNKCGTKNRVDPAREAVARCGKCGNALEVGKPSGDHGKPITVSDSNFQSEVAAPGTILIDCWAPWCGPCRMITPIMEDLAREANGRYRIGKLNVDDNPSVAMEYQIQSIPTMLIFKNGKLVDRLVGALPKQAIAERLHMAA